MYVHMRDCTYIRTYIRMYWYMHGTSIFNDIDRLIRQKSGNYSHSFWHFWWNVLRTRYASQSVCQTYTGYIIYGFIYLELSKTLDHTRYSVLLLAQLCLILDVLNCTTIEPAKGAGTYVCTYMSSIRNSEPALVKKGTLNIENSKKIFSNFNLYSKHKFPFCKLKLAKIRTNLFSV